MNIFPRLAEAKEMVDSAIRFSRRWYLPDVRERAIERAWAGGAHLDVCKDIAEILENGECLAMGDDPHDGWPIAAAFS